MQAEVPRGLCPVCKQLFTLNASGAVRAHGGYTVTERWCLGSRCRPLKADGAPDPAEMIVDALEAALARHVRNKSSRRRIAVASIAYLKGCDWGPTDAGMVWGRLANSEATTTRLVHGLLVLADVHRETHERLDDPDCAACVTLRALDAESAVREAQKLLITTAQAIALEAAIHAGGEER